MIFERKKYLDELIVGRGISAPRLNTTSQTSAFVQLFSTIANKRKRTLWRISSIMNSVVVDIMWM